MQRFSFHGQVYYIVLGLEIGKCGEVEWFVLIEEM